MSVTQAKVISGGIEGLPAHTMVDTDLQLTGSPLFSEYLKLLSEAGAGRLRAPKKLLGPRDAVLVIDMQNDFVPHADKKQGGRFAVAEGDLISPLCVQLIGTAIKNGGSVVATRDYHPVDHCSFLPDGPFPAHCVQGTPGSKLYPPIAKAMTEAIRDTSDSSGNGVSDGRASIAYKGFHEDIDSFGGLPYVGGGEGRITRRGSLMRDPFTGCTAAPWTGCLLFKCSGLHFDGDIDVDAPPDILAAVHGKPRGVEDLVEKLKNMGATRLLVCGLALDFCVCDTALNAIAMGFNEVSIVLDAARAAHIGGVGTFGSGFLSDPSEFITKLGNAGVTFTSTLALTGITAAPPPPLPVRGMPGTGAGGGMLMNGTALPVATRGQFPETLGPMGVDKTDRLSLSMGLDMSTFEITYRGAMRALQTLGVSNEGICTPFSAVTLPSEARARAKIPAAAKTFCFAYPLADVAKLGPRARTTFLASHHDPNWRFVCYGGFLYFDDTGTVLAANAMGTGGSLRFGSPQPWRSEFTNKLVSEGRFQPVTLNYMLAAGAHWFAWVHAGETLLSAVGPWEPAQHGAFVYLFHRDPTEVSAQDRFFPIVAA